MTETLSGPDAEARRTLRERARDRVRHPTWRGWFSVALVVLVAAGLAWWAVDASTGHGRVLRNVTVGGVDVGRMRPAELRQAVQHADGVYRAAHVELVAGRQTVRLTGADLGMRLDQAATVRDALAVGHHDPAVARPFLWIASFVQKRRSPVHLEIDTDKLAYTLASLPGQTPAKEPTLVGSPTTIGVSSSHGGLGYDADEVARQIRAEAADGHLPIHIRLTVRPTRPRFNDADAVLLAKEANDLTRSPVQLVAADRVAYVDAPTLRSWVSSGVGPRGLELRIDDTRARAAAGTLVGNLDVFPVDAAFTVVDDEVQVVPQVDGKRCCAAGTGAAILAGLRAHQSLITVPLVDVPPSFTTEDATRLGITTRLGTTTTFDGMTDDRLFTLAYDATFGMQANVEHAAAALRGRVLLPGQSLSLDATIGPPSPDNGYVAAEVPTRDGRALVPGGGTDIVASALFNAAFFAGLDIPISTRHTTTVPHLPPGREADLGWPGPDLVVHNDTGHAVMFWTRTAGTTVTVMVFGTPGSSGEQTGQTTTQTGPGGVCTQIDTVRTRHRADGSSAVDHFSAVYAPVPDDPGHGVAC